eukprot:12936999-Ditylum_brightwellii.AAC.1
MLTIVLTELTSTTHISHKRMIVILYCEGTKKELVGSKKDIFVDDDDDVVEVCDDDSVEDGDDDGLENGVDGADKQLTRLSQGVDCHFTQTNK